METIPKSPQELAATAYNLYPMYNQTSYDPAVDGGAEELASTANQLRQSIIDIQPHAADDDTVMSAVTAAEVVARETGVWNPSTGPDAPAHLDHLEKKYRGFGYPEDEVAIQALGKLGQDGALKMLRQRRKQHEDVFRQPTDKFVAENPMDETGEAAAIAELRARTYDIARLNPEARKQLAVDFPSGNFLFHSSNTARIVDMFSSGALMSVGELDARERQAAAAEGRAPRFIKRNTGQEGVSWSMNEIDGMPGDRFHIAGFVAAPESIMHTESQLAVPSRPAPYEVIQLSGDVPASDYYRLKTQAELYRSFGGTVEANSVYNNLTRIGSAERLVSNSQDKLPSLKAAVEQGGVLDDPNNAEMLRNNYTVDEHGRIVLAPDLLEQPEGAMLPAAAVWLQACIDTGRLKQFPDMDGKSVAEIIKTLDGATASNLLPVMLADYEVIERELVALHNGLSGVVDRVEDMYFAAPRKDVEKWLQVLARTGHSPKGILLYDDIKVRLENFSSDHRGDHGVLTEELRSAIVATEDTLGYEAVLGKKFDDSMRTGARGQVISEGHLADRKTIRLRDGKLATA